MRYTAERCNEGGRRREETFGRKSGASGTALCRGAGDRATADMLGVRSRSRY